MNKPVEIIVTARLALRNPLPSDLPILYDHVFSDISVMRHAFAGQPLSLPQATEFFERNFDHRAGGRRLGVLTIRATAEVIGFAGLLPCDALGKADYELGFVLRRSAWRHGYATEIGRGQLEYGFSTADHRRLLALVSPENGASIAVLKKIGMAFDSIIQSEERGVRQVYVAHKS
jgi:ribosomal-protein-alanine N-acetyltransferase